MGGRVYDPLAGRFTTADPIMQAPYWSQGQNRYAYVFNDPLNNTDPSGFMSSSDIAGGAAPGLIGGGITGGAYLATHSASLSGWGIGGGVGGGIGNVVNTLQANPFRGSGPGAFSVAAPSGTPNANPVKPGGTNAVGQASPPRVVKGTFGQDPHAPATCNGTGEPTCNTRKFGTSPLDQMVLRFLNSPHPAPGFDGTVADHTVEAGAPEVVAQLIQRADGTYRLSQLLYSNFSDMTRVDFQLEALGAGERLVGMIHNHPALLTHPLAQSRGIDLPTGRQLARLSPHFTASYVVGPSGKGPYFGIIVFEPAVTPNLLTTVLP